MSNRAFYAFTLILLTSYALLSLWTQPQGLNARQMIAAPMYAEKTGGLIRIFGGATETIAEEDHAFDIKGIVQATKGQSSIIVSTAGGGGRVVAVGEKIVAGRVLKAVYADHAVVDVDGKPTRVDLPKPNVQAPRDTGRQPAVAPQTTALGVSARPITTNKSQEPVLLEPGPASNGGPTDSATKN